MSSPCFCFLWWKTSYVSVCQCVCVRVCFSFSTLTHSVFLQLCLVVNRFHHFCINPSVRPTFLPSLLPYFVCALVCGAVKVLAEKKEPTNIEALYVFIKIYVYYTFVSMLCVILFILSFSLFSTKHQLKSMLGAKQKKRTKTDKIQWHYRKK